MIVHQHDQRVVMFPEAAVPWVYTSELAPQEEQLHSCYTVIRVRGFCGGFVQAPVGLQSHKQCILARF